VGGLRNLENENENENEDEDEDDVEQHYGRDRAG
jgi:hypothetical protein